MRAARAVGAIAKALAGPAIATAVLASSVAGFGAGAAMAAPPAPPPAGGYFRTLAPGSALPSDAECAARVHRTGWEPRPENNKANHTVPTGPLSITAGWGGDTRAEALKKRITGNFTGTTDEIIQWGACKWGFEDELVRAQAKMESNWHQRTGHNKGFGDYTNNREHCPPGYTTPCPTSFGILQVRHPYHQGTFPWSRDSTAFGVDYTLAMRRACFEGWLWVGPRTRGDEWGCYGLWNSGSWYDGDQEYRDILWWDWTHKYWREWEHQSP